MTPLERLELVDLAQNDGEARALFMEACRRDVVFFVNTCCWTFNPQLQGDAKHMPFLLMPRQEEFVRFMEQSYVDQENWGVDKSRKVGASWCAMARILWHWLYEPGYVALIGSYKEEFVDRSGDPDSLFWKIDYMYSGLPAWMKVLGYTGKQPLRTSCKIENPVTGAIIGGAAGTRDFGRSGRASEAFLDELASWFYPREAWTAVGQTSPVVGMVSTPKGMNFFGKSMNPKTEDERGSMRRMRMHWKDDPRFNEEVMVPGSRKPRYPWYEKECRRYNNDPTIIAQELDVSYKASAGKLVYPGIQTVRLAKLTYDHRLPLLVAWDFGVGDDTAIGWYQWDYVSSVYRMIDYYQSSGHAIDWYVPFVTGQMPSGDRLLALTERETEMIRRHRTWIVTEHYGDPAGKQRSGVTATSVIDELVKHGVYVGTNSKAVSFEARRAAAQRLLQIMEIDERRCEDFVEAMQNARYPERPETSNSMSAADKPIHDWCLAGETRIRTLDGWFAVKDLAGMDFWTWSYSEERKRLVPAKASRCWMSGVGKKTILIGLDDGHEVRCTPDHPFMRRDGTYVEAQYLRAGDSLMPFYEKNDGGYKVRFVRHDMLEVDVYDIEVPIYHNFVAEGVVTHNTSHGRSQFEYLAVNEPYSNQEQRRYVEAGTGEEEDGGRVVYIVEEDEDSADYTMTGRGIAGY